MLLENIKGNINLFRSSTPLTKLHKNNSFSKSNSPKNTLKNLNNNLFKKDIDPKSQIKFITENFSSNITQPTLLRKKIRNSIFNNLELGKRWTDEEQNRFAEALLKYGNDWRKIQENVVSRNMTQVRSHAQKYLIKLKKNKLLINKGLEKNANWNDVIKFMKNNFNNEEMKNIIFHAHENNKKNYKSYLKTIDCSKEKVSTINIDENYIKKFDNEIWNNEINNKNNDKNCEVNNEISDYKKNNDEENEEEKLLFKKFLQCFNSTSENITLNTSFEDYEYNNNYINYNPSFENEQSANFNNNIIDFYDL